MELLCINCGYDIDARTANIQTNLVQCPNCHQIHKVNLLLDKQGEIDKMPVVDFAEKVQPSNEIFDNNQYEIMPARGNFKSPPSDSRVEFLETITSLEIIVPKRRFKPEDIFLAIFTTFWLCFVFVWTGLALWGAGILFALFSIPFWLVGIGMASGLLKGLTEKQIIELDRYTLMITKVRLLSKKIYEIDVEDIKSIEIQRASIANSLKNIRFTSKNNLKKGINGSPTIKTKKVDITLFESLSKAEQDWGIRIIKQGVAKFSERNL